DPRRLHLQGHRPCVSRSDPGPVQGTVRPQGGGQGLRCGCGRAPEGSDRPQHPSGERGPGGQGGRHGRH
ncbi:50S ribosomal protein L31, partial [Dysosmobacter welbionis]